MKIKMLNHETINKIAAGEVIIRPVSVIKELLENAIDAGATRIAIALQGGGKNKIVVSDNGIGIAYNDIPLAFKRHATSKLSTIEDLESIGSFGFRGEALSSISAVARVQITTRSRDEEVGTLATFENGNLTHQRVCAYNQGTEMLVEDLFYNVPARRKHLSKDKKEEALVRDLVEKMAISQPEIAFKLSCGGRVVLDTSGSGKCMDVVRGLYGRDVAENLIDLVYDNEPMKLRGFIGNLKTMRGHREDQLFFINGRYVKTTAFAKVLDEAYEGYTMKHQHPMGIIFVELPGRMLDVNIHPAKTEVKILNESLVCLLFKQGIREMLKKANLIVDLGAVGRDWEDEKKVMPVAPIRDEGEQSTFVLGKTDPQWHEPLLEVRADNDADFRKTTHEEKRETASMGKMDPPMSTTEPPSGAVRPSEQSELDKAPVFDAKNKTTKYELDQQSSKIVSEKEAMEQNPRTDIAKAQTINDTGTIAVDPSSYPQNKTDSLQKGFSSLQQVAEDLEPFRSLDEEKREPSFKKEVEDLANLKIIGRLFNAYILLEAKDTIYLLDQHAAHEAFLTEELMAIFKHGRGFPSQCLMTPIPVKIRPKDFKRIEETLADYKTLGYECDVFGDDVLLVRSVPVFLGEPQTTALLTEMIAEDLFEGENHLETKTVLSEKMRNRVITMACKAAIKGGQPLDEREIRKLLQNLSVLDNPYTCPHGRPIILKLKEYELMKLFKRVV